MYHLRVEVFQLHVGEAEVHVAAVAVAFAAQDEPMVVAGWHRGVRRELVHGHRQQTQRGVRSVHVGRHASKGQVGCSRTKMKREI